MKFFAIHAFVLAAFCTSVSLSAQNKTTPLSTAYLENTIQHNRVYLNQGKVADYIPELAKANAQAMGIAIVSPEGLVYKAGDAQEKFTMQSISKLVALMIAVEDWGEASVFERVGYYGTSLPFNDFSHLETMPTPLNPMMNAGAIVTTAFIKGEGDTAFQRILDRVRYITNNPTISMNEAVYLSEKETGHRNRGMFHILKNKELINKDEEALNNYFKQCSIEIHVEDLAKIAYFFANECTRFDGDTTYKNSDISELILSQMLTAGMYDYSGAYARKIGIPSKSGVGGGIIASDPKSGYGIAVFSPALDTHGNSLIGSKMLEELSKELGLSVFKNNSTPTLPKNTPKHHKQSARK